MRNLRDLRASRLKGERGLTLVEILVAVTILSIGLLAVASGSSAAARQVLTGRRDVGVWSAVQQEAEVLTGLGYKKVKTDSAVVQGYPLQWTVTGTNPKKLVLQATWTNTSMKVVKDTLVLYFAAQDTLP
jgi:prepilin-type N-terminal cleavage/methylation domain-containing protein